MIKNGLLLMSVVLLAICVFCTLEGDFGSGFIAICLAAIVWGCYMAYGKWVSNELICMEKGCNKPCTPTCRLCDEHYAEAVGYDPEPEFEYPQ